MQSIISYPFSQLHQFFGFFFFNGQIISPENFPGKKTCPKYFTEKTKMGVIQRSLLVLHFNCNLLVGAGRYCFFYNDCVVATQQYCSLRSAFLYVIAIIIKSHRDATTTQKLQKQAENCFLTQSQLVYTIISCIPSLVRENKRHLSNILT